MRRALLWAPLGALLLTLGCGPAADLWLTLKAPLRVPDQCDSVEVDVSRDGHGIYARTFALDGKQQFPMTLSLSTRSGTDVGTPLHVTAVARLHGADVAPAAATDVTLSDREVTAVTLRIVLP